MARPLPQVLESPSYFPPEIPPAGLTFSALLWLRNMNEINSQNRHQKGRQIDRNNPRNPRCYINQPRQHRRDDAGQGEGHLLDGVSPFPMLFGH